MAQALPTAARRLDRYEVLAELASGGMATVYLGRLPGAGGFERLVAIKRLHPHLERDQSFVDMFLDEARIAARIRHPNVVSTLEIGTAERGYFLVMDYVEGPTLARLLSRAAHGTDKMPVRVALRILHDTVSGLHAAHELKDDGGNPLHLVHRDVSPQNVLIGLDGTSRITDFGVARALNRISHTRTGQLKGKLGYMAPEQARGDDLDRRADLFAAGVLLWETLAGKRLFRGKSDTDAETLSRVLTSEIPRIKLVNPEVPDALDAFVARALERKIEQRFANGADMIDALEAAAGPLLGTSRDVAKYVEATVGEEIAKRRDALRSMSAVPMEDELAGVPQLFPSSVSSTTLSVAHTRPSGPVSVVVQHAPPPQKSQAVVIGVLAGALIVTLGGIGLLLFAKSTPSPPPAQRPVTTGSAVVAPPPPSAAPAAEPAASVTPSASAAPPAPSASVAPPPKVGGPLPRGTSAPSVPKGDGLETSPYR